jgi:hypothetical protein
MERRLHILGAGLVLLGTALLGVDIAFQVDDGLARSIADNSTCSGGPCTMDQLRTAGLFAGPITFLVCVGFGLALIKMRLSQAQPPAR